MINCEMYLLVAWDSVVKTTAFEGGEPVKHAYYIIVTHWKAQFHINM